MHMVLQALLSCMHSVAGAIIRLCSVVVVVTGAIVARWWGLEGEEAACLLARMVERAWQLDLKRGS